MKKLFFCHMKCCDMKHILALPTYQKIYSDNELEQIDFGKFDLGHPVLTSIEPILVSFEAILKRISANTKYQL